MKHSKRIAASVAALAVAAVGLTGIAPAQAANKTDLVIGAVAEPTTWDPIGANIGHFIPYYQAVYDNLILRAPDGSYKPNLATKWQVADDSKSMTIDLRSGVKFTDGAAFNADAAKANLDAYIGGVGPYTAKLSGTTVSVVDSDTIKLTMSTPNPEIVYWLATTGSFMASPNVLKTAGLKTKPVGSGPYILDSATVGSQYVFKANPSYWDKSKQKFSKITIKFLSDATARLNALLGGQVDAAYLTAGTVAAAKSKGKTLYSNSRAVDYKGIVVFDRNGNKNPALGDVRVRQAMNYAIDRAALAKAVEVNAEPTTQIFSPAGTAYKKSLDNYYKFDLAKAKSLMAAAGYADGFTLNLNNWVEPNLNALVESYLKAINIKVNWVQDTNWYPNAKAGKFEAIIMSIFQGTDLVTAETATAKDGSWNCLKYESPAMKKAWAALSQSGTANQVKVQTANMNQIAVEEAWFVPFYRVLHYVATSNRVKTVVQAQNAVPYLYNYAPTGK
ncbi:MAG: hypothetical protein RLZZ471_410 [Actinomycetota bacterium]|jgi:peptide/nickel transport system substrate-binding protein